VSVPQLLVRVEGAAVAAVTLVLYFHAGHPWWLLVVLVLAPDLSMLGYTAGVRVGAASYNVAHTYTLPLVLGVFGVLADTDLAVELALIWGAHIGVDRALGYGLKYPTGFKDTHLQRI
jgi:hypothetical protein